MLAKRSVKPEERVFRTKTFVTKCHSLASMPTFSSCQLLPKILASAVLGRMQKVAVPSSQQRSSTASTALAWNKTSTMSKMLLLLLQSSPLIKDAWTPFAFDYLVLYSSWRSLGRLIWLTCWLLAHAYPCWEYPYDLPDYSAQWSQQPSKKKEEKGAGESLSSQGKMKNAFP